MMSLGRLKPFVMGNLLFYVRKAWKDFVDPIQFGASDCYPHHPDWPYALNYSAHGMVDLYEMKRDEDGIVMMPPLRRPY